MNKILLKIMIASLGLLSSSILLAADEQNSVKGSVITNSQGIPLQGANVELHGDNNQNHGVTTD